MKTTLCTWEDEDCNRQIQFSIEYSIVNRAVRIKRVNPLKVTFVCPRTNTVRRSLGVHTSSGRRLLARRFESSPAFRGLAAAIANPNADTRPASMSIRMDICGIG